MSFPILKRKAPLITLVRGQEGFRERPLLGILAETPEEIRELRRYITGALAIGLAVSAFLPPLLERTPKPK